MFCEDERGGRRPGRGREDEVGAPVPEEVAELFEGDVKKFVNDVLVNKQHYLKRDRIDSPDTEVQFAHPSLKLSWTVSNRTHPPCQIEPTWCISQYREKQFKATLQNSY